MKTKSLIDTLLDAAKRMDFDQATMDKLEALKIPKVRTYSPNEIKKLRRKAKVSQGVFAALLNVNPSTIQKWEQGSVKPQSAALKLLNVLDKHGVEALDT